VEQVDVEDYGRFAGLNANSPYVTTNQELYQPPVKTITWTHLGAALDDQRIQTTFLNEYFPARYPFQGGFREKVLPDSQLPPDLDDAGWREALRACKGMTLRREVYELDINELVAGRERPVRLLTASQSNCRVTQIQPAGTNRYGV